MAWQLLSVLPNLDLHCAFEAREAAIVPSGDARVAELSDIHPNLATFLASFRTAHGRPVAPAVMLLDDAAPDSRRTGDAMVAFRNSLSVATLLNEHALDLLYPDRGRILFSDTFEFYPWTLDRDYAHMTSITPALWAIHRVSGFTGQPLAGAPIHSLRRYQVDEPLFTALTAQWNPGYTKSRLAPFPRVLFRSLNMANAALAMPAVQGATHLDYGRQCALWISAFEILAHYDSGRGRADLTAVLDLLEKKPHWFRRLNARRYRVRLGRNRTRPVGLAGKLYAKLYRVRNDILHGNPVSVGNLLLKRSGRFIGHFAPILYRCALRNYLDLRFVPGGAAHDAHDYEEPQYDAERALLLAREKPSPDDEK